MQFINGQIRFSPSDLTKFMESEYSSWMDRWHLELKAGNHSQVVPCGFEGAGIEICEPDDCSEELEIIAAKGIEHEKQFLESLPSDDVAKVPSGRNSIQATRDAIAQGSSVIFQAHLVSGRFAGYADFLMRVDGESDLGNYLYEVADTKLARSPKPYFIIQLCCYADMLEAIQGRRPAGFEVILGTNGRVRFETDKFFSYYQSLKNSFLEFQDNFDLTSPPHPGLAKSYGQWGGFAEAVLESSDHLSKVAKITRSQIKKLESAGVTTFTQLATQKIANVPKLSLPTLRNLQWQARMQLDSIGKDRPLYDVIEPKEGESRLGLQLLPPSSPNDVFFDMEGYPLVDGGLEYLFGATHFEDGEIAFSDWWAHDLAEEKKAFEGFIDWAHARWKSDPSLHIYHYAAYEVSTIKRLMGKFATREEKVDNLLRNHVFVDLYTVTRQGIVLGTPSYSLKYVEHLYMDAREGEVTTSGGSIVAYHRWIESDQSPDWKQSEILEEIRDYNEVDCVSTWKLAEWLRGVQEKHGIDFVYPHVPEAKPEPNTQRNSYNDDAVVLADRLIAEVDSGAFADVEQRRIKQLHAWLLEFHWREARPVIWRKHSMAEMTQVELIEDQNCLGALERIDAEPEKIKKSLGYHYRFQPTQQTKLRTGSRCLFASNTSQRTEIVDLDLDAGTLLVKLGSKAPDAPNTLSLIPDEFVSAKAIANAVYRYVDAWANNKIISPAIDDLIHRRPPSIRGHKGGELIDPKIPVSEATIELIQRMDSAALCVQGPPGTGKTFTAAKAIVQLLQDGKRIAVTANGHKAILNVLSEVQSQLAELGVSHDVFKATGSRADAEEIGCKWVRESKGVAGVLDGRPCVVGGTAWVFSREELQGEFDYLFVDEAGQFSLANVVGAGCCADNIVLMGDQMQLASPVQGAHPGESGESALEYYLDGSVTVPPESGVLLNQTWRMSPDLSGFISDAIYESRLGSHPNTANQQVHAKETGFSLIAKSAGIQFLPVIHEGNSQGSPEEVDLVARLFDELLESGYANFSGDYQDNLTADDILVVAPFNLQVRMLQERLGHQARVGTVDKFQGQQAAVVIVSMCSSTIEDSPRGADFLLNPNRLNVALSRAKALAIVVGSPDIAESECNSIREMELVNLYCRITNH